jgi:hypothetical protein
MASSVMVVIFWLRRRRERYALRVLERDRRWPCHDHRRCISGGLLLHCRQREVSGSAADRVVACRVVRVGRGRLGGGEPGLGW